MPNYSILLNKIRVHKTHIAIFIVGLLFLTLGLLGEYHTTPFNSDDVAQKLIVHQTVEAHQVNILTPPDNFVLKLPINILVNWLVKSPSINLFVSAWVMNALGLLMFFVVGLYFIRKYTKDRRATWVFWLAYLLLCVNSSNIFLYDIRSPQIRTIEIGLAFVILWAIDKVVMPAGKVLHSRQLLLKPLIISVLCGILLYSDPAFIIFLIAPIVLVAVLTYRQLGRDRLIKLGLFAAGSLVSYEIFGKIFKLIGVHTYAVPSNFVSWEMLGHNISIATQGLLSLQDAMIFGRPLFSAGTILVAANLIILITVAIYIPLRLAKTKDYWLLFFAVQPIFLFCAYFLSSNVVDLASSRYLILLPFYMALILAIGLVRLYGGAKERAVMTVIISFLVLLCIGQVAASAKIYINNRHNNPNAYVLQVSSAVKSLDIAKGYAPYWNAGINSFYSNYTSNIFPVTCEGNAIVPYYWNVSGALYNKLSSPSFILVSNTKAQPISSIESTNQNPLCSVQSVIKQFGNPARVKNVTNYTEIFIYNYDILTKMPGRRTL